MSEEHELSRKQAYERFIRPRLRSPRLIRLVPRQPLFLNAINGNGPLFATRFLQTWRRIPLRARRRWLKFWRTEDSMKSLVPFSPHIELIEDWSHDGKKPPFGVVSRDGHMLRFCSKYFDQMPDNVACDVIAHELAHVSQNVSGSQIRVADNGSIYFEYPDGYKSTLGEEEEEADSRMDWWGFDPESVDRWALEAGITKTTNDFGEWLKTCRYI